MRPPRAAPLPWLGGLLALYLVVPVVAFLIRLGASNQGSGGGSELLGALYVSVVTATVSAALVAVLGVPLAYVLSRSEGRLSTLAGAAVQLPLALPPLMGGILLVQLVGPYTALGQFFGRHLTDSMAGVVLAQTFVASPFLVVTARSAFAAVDRSVTEHAATLGHRELARFWRVSLPIAGPGIRAGLVLAWLRAFGEYGATVVLAYHPYTLPVLTYVRFSGTGIPATQGATAAALVVAFVVATAGRLHLPRRARPTGPPAEAVAPRPGPGRAVGCHLDVRLGTFHLEVAHQARSARLAVLGPSGSGKSAVLRALAGLLGPDAGEVTYGGRPVQALPVEGRHVGYVPQGYGLLPHLAVHRQLLFGVGADPGLATYWVDRLRLGGLEGRRPAELSGGQRQRVALAQVLACSPDLVLLDEPFSALDTAVRLRLRSELRRLQQEAGLSTVLVTHDPEEAAYLADEVVVLSEGRVLQAGAVAEVFTRPASPEVASLLGVRNLLPGRVRGPGRVQAFAPEAGRAGAATGRTGTGRSAEPGPEIGARTGELPEGTEVVWGVRAEHVAIAPGDGVPSDGHRGRVVDVVDLGAVTEVLVALPGGVELQARVPHRVSPEVGSPCGVSVPAGAVGVWPVPAAAAAGAAGDGPTVPAARGRRSSP